MFKFRYIYGPVYSWRLGRSLGVDPLSFDSKVCNMDCVYCQLGKTASLTHERKEYVPTQDIIEEIREIPLHFVDYITFSGRGEPTLASNLGEMVRAVKDIRHERTAVITNGLLLKAEDVCDDLMAADFVLIKLDAGHQEGFEAVDRISEDFGSVVEGIKEFRRSYHGKMALQIMLVEQNFDQIGAMAQLARDIAPQEIQLNTPLRPSAAKPIDRSRMEWAKRFFKDMPVVTVYDAPPMEYTPMDAPATASRHGNFRKTRSYI